jgi:hypothetical protein
MDKNIINAAVLSAVGGLGLGYALGRRRSSRAFDKAVAESSEEYREHFLRERTELEERILDQETVYEKKLTEFSIVAADATNALTAYRGEQDLIQAADEISQRESMLTAEEMDYDKTEDEGLTPDPEPVPQLEAPWQPDPRNAPSPMRKPTPPKPKPREPYVDKSKPYVVPVQEFLENESNWSQSTLTYYEGDDTLADDKDAIMDDRSRLVLVGTNLSDFGKLSDSENSVYIKNEKMMLYIEVVKSEGKYSEEVAGLGG